MSFKTRVSLSFGLFILLTAGLGAGLMVNSFREESAFRAGRNALRAQYMTQELDYFMSRKFRALEAYVLLDEETEKYQIREADSVIRKKFDIWEQWAKSGDASAQELAAVKEIAFGAAAVEARVTGLMESDRKRDAMSVVASQFRPLAEKLRAKLQELAAKKVQDAVEAERTMIRVVRQSHLTSVAGIVVAIVLGVVLAMSLYNSVMLPMKVIAMWSEQIARGHLHVSLDVPADENSEVGRIARGFNEMVKNLARQPPPQPVFHAAAVERDIPKPLPMEQEQITTLEDAVDGFREVLDIMGAAPAVPKDKK